MPMPQKRRGSSHRAGAKRFIKKLKGVATQAQASVTFVLQPTRTLGAERGEAMPAKNSNASNSDGLQGVGTNSL